MAQTIMIDPVTRIEGHSKITLMLDDDGVVQNAQFHVTQLRGFEKFCEGRPFYEMPSLMARVCGICPVSHLMASSKACDALMAVRIPPVAAKLRTILNLGQLIQSHALSFFHLASPDFLLGMDADPAIRNIVGVLQTHPELARDGIRLRQFGQQIIEWLAGKRIHPTWVVPGGVSLPLTAEKRARVVDALPEAYAIIERTLDWYLGVMDTYTEEIETFANFPTLYMGLIDREGGLEHYDGTIRIMDAEGRIVADRLDPSRYFEYIGEAVEPFSYLKSPYYLPLGYPDGIYRVGPLARLNIVDKVGTPRAEAVWASFAAAHKMPAQSSYYYHFARLVEILHGIERVEALLNAPDILDMHVRALAGPNSPEGVGVSEAPRGTLIHHYKIDDNGLMTHANLIIATGHNNLAMNRGVLQVAQHFVKGNALQEGMLNRVEAVIRAFDPCLSCSTHALNTMALHVQLLDPQGEVLDELWRN